MITPKLYDALLKDLNGNRVSILNGKFSYLEAWDVKRYLIRFFGFGGFDSVVEHQEVLSQRERFDEKGKVTGWHVTALCRVRLVIHNAVPVYGRVDHDDVDPLAVVVVGYGPATYTEVATATNTSSTLGDALDNAMKSAESDGLKRAAINLGTQFGLSLYNEGSKEDVVKSTAFPPEGWVPLDQREQEGEGVPTDEAKPVGTTALPPAPVSVQPPVPGEASDDAPDAPEESQAGTSDAVVALADKIRAAAQEKTVAKRMGRLRPIVDRVSKDGSRTWVLEDGTTIGRLLDLALNGKLGEGS